jgi:hypothetical protein
MNSKRTRNLLAAAALLFVAGLGCIDAMKALPYSSSAFERVDGDADAAPTKESFRVGSLEWHMDELAQAPQLEPLRTYFHAHCTGQRGLAAATCLSDSFARAFAQGEPTTEFVNASYDSCTDLARHAGGEAGHCVTRSGLAAAVLLSVGIPARVVQIIPSETRGHNLFEVWDEKNGWTLYDPSFGGTLMIGDRAVSAMQAAHHPTSVRWSKVALSPNDAESARDTYANPEAPAFGGQIIYPEPWLYMRLGPRATHWPFRGAFAFYGPRAWRYGIGQSVLRIGTVVASLASLAFAIAALLAMRANARARRPLEARTAGEELDVVGAEAADG